MEFLYRDGSGNIPIPSTRSVGKTTWVSPNMDCNDIPLESMESRARAKGIKPEDMAIGPNGTFLGLEWTQEIDWHERDTHWRAFCPIPTTEFSMPSHLVLDLAEEFHVENLIFTVRMERRDALTACLKEYWSNVIAITTHEPFDDGNAYPLPFDWTLLARKYDTAHEVTDITAKAVQSAINYAAFMVWWTSSITGWDKTLPQVAVGRIRHAVNSVSPVRRGILVDLETSWRELNVPHLIACGVPIAYKWSKALEADERFLRLSPRILLASLPAPEEPSAADVTMAGTSISRNDRIALSLYDKFLDDIEPPSDAFAFMSAPINDGSVYQIIDFKGWQARYFYGADTAREYATRYQWSSELSPLARIPFVIFYRFRPRSASGVSDASISVSEECRRGPREIRELYKGKCAPTPTEMFDLSGRSSSVFKYYDPRPIDPTSRLRDRISTSGHDKDYSPFKSPSPSAACSLQQRISSPPLLTSNPRHRPSHTRSPSTTSSKAASPTGSRWVNEMTRAGRGPSRRLPRESSLSASDDSNRGRRRQRFRDSDPTFSRPGDRSASPAPVTGRTSDVAHAMHETFIRRVRFKGLNLVQERAEWKIDDDAVWNLELLQHGFLLFWDLGAQVRVRYWANCSPEIYHLRQVLERAITHGVRFSICVHTNDMAMFRPPKISEMDRILSRRIYEPSYQEPKIEYGTGITFANQYLGKLADILRRPHARALIGLGGPASWIARQYGDNLVQQFMNGPSIQVTYHGKGYVDSRDAYPAFIHCDQMSEGELDLVYGRIRSDNGEKDHWVFPSPELLDELCDHWSGEWTPECERAFVMVKTELNGSKAKPRTRGEWRIHFRQDNRNNPPAYVVTEHDFSDLRNMMVDGGFPADWNKKCLSDIEFPERFLPPASGK